MAAQASLSITWLQIRRQVFSWRGSYLSCFMRKGTMVLCGKWSFKRATSRENLSLGFATRVDSNRPAQLQRLATVLKFRLSKYRYYTISRQRTTKALIRLRGFLMMWLKHSNSHSTESEASSSSLYSMLSNRPSGALDGAKIPDWMS